MKPGNVIQVLLLSVFGLFWTGLVGFSDWHVGGEIVQQIAATRFPAAPAQITHSEVVYHSGSKGGSYQVDIRYRYEVAGQSFEGQRFRYHAGASSDSAWARKAVAEYPVGSSANIYYNPKKIDEAVLSPGLDGSDLMIVLFLTPFNIVMIGIWAGVWLGLRKMVPPSDAGGVEVVRDGFIIRVRLPVCSAIVAALIAMGGMAFIFTFIVAFTGGGFHPSLGLTGSALAAAYGAGVVVYIWQWRKIKSGDDDLIIDQSSRTVGLPETYGRKDRVTVGFAEILGISVETLEHTGSKGGTTYTYAPILQLHGRHSDGEKLADWSDKDRAQAFASWLREQLGLTPGAA